MKFAVFVIFKMGVIAKVEQNFQSVEEAEHIAKELSKIPEISHTNIDLFHESRPAGSYVNGEPA